MKSWILGAALLILFIGQGWTQPPQREVSLERVKILEEKLKTAPGDTKLLMKLGISYHSFAEKGQKNAVKKAEAVFKTLLQIEPKNSEALVWYGSVLALKGRDAWFPFLKIKYVNDGLKKMDQAVWLDSANITVRMTRASTCIALPENIFHRIKTAIQDFEYLVILQKKHPEMFDKKLSASIFLELGNGYKKSGDIIKARENWQRAVNAAADSKEAEEAKNLLRKTDG